ncbi:CTD nuclear envelope phosphatase 1 isoform X2 [Cynara cardunculus var. scolymus]|uniref:CTD nuclear envelope phosphatase 1 isoform X2 n=1 Tax=Cynara cardunculus var. scolymus TaxID=59895 RepID=UPI000D62CBB5|nr:CTD nuclear envelope phosphatase 1 isoform X2 [Cynara cardunculus var. scolymus]
MVELGQADTEVYAPKRTLQVWRTLLNWLAFFFQIFVQIIKATPSLINYSSSPSFEPLPVVELSESPQPPTPYAASTVHIPPAGADFDRSQKLTVVLDLDETLVCAYETSSLPAIVRNQAIEAGLKWFELECVSSDKALKLLYTIAGYAKPLVDRIDAENRFNRRLYRPSTSSTEFREHVKDLSCISTNFCRIVIVDNNPFSFLLQPVNGIPCIPFSAGQPHDDQLLEVLLPLLKQLSEQGDVRPVLYEKFHMPEWFDKHGIPTSGWATHG